MLKMFCAVGARRYVRIYTYTPQLADPGLAIFIPLAWRLDKAFGRVYFWNMTRYKYYAVYLMNLNGFDEYVGDQ